MALQVSRESMSSLRSKAERYRNRLKNLTNKADEKIATVVHTAEVGSAAFIAGVVQGRTGGIHFLGVPLDLGMAAGLHVLAFAGVGGAMSSHLHGFGDGFLAAFLATTGRGVGSTWRAKTKSSGMLPGGHADALPGGAHLSAADRRIASMAAAI